MPEPKRGQKLSKPQCHGDLSLFSSRKSPATSVYEVTSGHLECRKCHSKFPILGGVAILVESVRDYLLSHVKGIAQAVPDSEIPKEYLHDYLEAKAEIQVEHIEEDLEAERIIALYVMNHYLRVKSSKGEQAWWKSRSGQGSPLIESLIHNHWDQGPFAQIERWVAGEETQFEGVELGCGVGGLYLRPQAPASDLPRR